MKTQAIKRRIETLEKKKLYWADKGWRIQDKIDVICAIQQQLINKLNGFGPVSARRNPRCKPPKDAGRCKSDSRSI